jgi:PAS domain S-box-containing protein
VAREVATEGMVVVGPSGLIEDVDDVVCELLGYTRAEVVGLHGADLIPESARPKTAVSIDRMRRGEVTARVGTMRCKDGSVIGVDVERRATADGRLVLAIRRRADA